MVKKTNYSKTKQKSLAKGIFWRVFFYISLLLLLFCVGVAIYLNSVVVNQFEGKKWTLPARVYAQPLTLFEGKKIREENLLFELKAINYRAVKRGRKLQRFAGTFAKSGSTWWIHTRAFQYWDEKTPEKVYRFRFSNNQISDISDINGNKVSIIKIDPALIASIYPNHREDRDLVKLADVPVTLIEALVAVEDRKFYKHHGVNPLAIARAVVRNIQAGRTVQGGSTLTQQLVKNYFLTNERTLSRKFSEMIMSFALEWHYDKEEILEAYLNEIFLGQDKEREIHGFGLAARHYFDVPLKDTSIEQQALLIGLVKGANFYNPRRHPERALKRRNLVLKLMFQAGSIDENMYSQAKQKPLNVVDKPKSLRRNFPDFIDLVKRQLKNDYEERDLRSQGLRIFTTLSLSAQYQLQKSIAKHLDAIDADSKLEASAIVTSVATGDVLALAGSRYAPNEGFNRALDAKRQIGSLAKPAVYLTAFMQGYTPNTLIADVPFEWNDKHGHVWRPQNYDHQSHGLVPMYQGLVKSYNLSSARLGLDVGVDNVSHTLKKLGLDASWNDYPSILLGAVESSVFGVAQMYQTLAADGFYSRLIAVKAVVNADGERLNRYDLEVESRLDSTAVFMVNHVLQQVVLNGTARKIGLSLPNLNAAGKTGTTNNGRDAWFAGFTGEHLSVVWVGRDDAQPAHLSGSRAALPIWQGLFKHIYSRPYYPGLPSGVDWAWINQEGERVEDYCETSVKMPFKLESMPEQTAICTYD